jgi:hypothetical protein
MKIFLDFDGMVVEHTYPHIGKYNEGCFDVLKKLVNLDDVHIILNTYRSNISEESLNEAKEYLLKNGFNFESTSEKISPYQWNWNSIKNLQTMFIDDIAPNIPLKNNMVDWIEIDKQLKENNIY